MAAPSVRRLQEEYESIAGRRGRPVTAVDFAVGPQAWGWVEAVAEGSDWSRTDLLNLAVGFAAVRQLAQKHGLQALLMSGRTLPDELPEERPPFEFGGDDTHLHIDLSSRNYRLMTWMNSSRDMSYESVVKDGVRILGALALAPADQELVVVGGSERLRMRLPRPEITGAPPFPE